MARVYRATDTYLQRTVALKILAAQLSLDPEFVRRFEREAATAAQLRHPAIVTIYDVGELDGLYYIAMEYIQGRSLHALLEERTALGLGFAIALLEPVAQALDHAHRQGAVHRDIKPHNILLNHDGRVLLTDFGIAQTSDADSERLTRTGVFMGTPEYISPEQAEARRVDGRSDLYSLGVVAYEIVTGRVPFSGPTPQLIVAHAQLPPPPPTSVLAHLPSELDLVLVRALAKRSDQRYATGAALVADLKQVAERYHIPQASTAQLAELAQISPRMGPQPRIEVPPAQLPRPVAPQPRPPAPIGAPTLRPTPAERPPARPNNPTPARPNNPNGRPAAGRPSTRLAEREAQTAWSLPVLVLGSILVLITLLLIFVVAQSLANNPPAARPTPGVPTAAITVPIIPPTTEPTVTFSPTPSAAPTEQATLAPTETLAPEPTAQPTAPPASPIPPQPTTAPSPTLEPSPTATDTPIPPSETPTTEPTPTITETPTETATPTLTATPTVTPTEEPTAILPPATVVTPQYPGP
jgi:serine/threonine-protein kinase